MKKLKNKWFYIYSLFLYLILILIFTFLAGKFIKPQAYSFLLSNITSNYYPNTDVIEVIVDDITNQKYNWNNDPYNKLTADLLGYFNKYAKPAVVGMDINFVSIRDNIANESHDFIHQVKSMDNLVSAFLPEYNKSGDDKRFMDDFKKKNAINVTLKTKNNFKTEFTGIQNYSDILRKNTKNYASVLIKKDKGSGYIFDAIHIIKINDDFYPSLSLRMYLMLNKTNEIEIYDDYIYVPKTGLQFQYTYNNGCFMSPIRYYSFLELNNAHKTTYSHIAVSALKIFETYDALNHGITPKTHPERYNPNNQDSLLNPELFKDKIVYIGVNISGPSDDVLKTPMGERHPGVDIQATTIDNLLSQNTIYKYGITATILAFILLCIPTFILIMKTKFIKGLVSLILLDLFYMIFVIIVGTFGYVIDYSIPLVCQFVTAIFGYTFKFLNESRNKEQIKNAMGKYISKDVLNNVVINNIENLGLGGKKAIVTVLFADIRGFTSLSEKMTAEEVSVILNEYFAEIEPIILKYNGVINKFIGDAVMAIFGEPIEDINHPLNAVKCAYEMLKKVEYLREKWLCEGKPKIEIGVGINTGEVFIGNIGTENRMEYTVIGDTVNLASRIEGYNKVYRTNLLVSSTTYNYISDKADVIKIKEVQIRGKAKKMDIYEVLRIDL